MAGSQSEPRSRLELVDPVWSRLRDDATEAIRGEPSLAGLMVTSILNQTKLEHAVAHRVASRLHHVDLPAELIRQAFEEAVAEDESFGHAFRADLLAVMDRDPAATRFIEPLGR